MSDVNQSTVPQAATSSAPLREPLTLAGYAAALLVAVGSFGTWAKSGQFSASGMDGDGVLTLVGACVAAAALFVVSVSGPTPRLGADWTAAVAAAFAMFIAVYDSFEIPKTYELLGDLTGERTAGWGIWLTLVGSVVLTAVTVYLVIRARFAPKG